jgi:hypothetical protein
MAGGVVDGKSLATYLSLLLLVLPPEGLRREEADRFPPLADPLFTGTLSGSPLKTPTRYMNPCRLG